MHADLISFAGRLRSRACACAAAGPVADAEFGRMAAELAELQAAYNPAFAALCRGAGVQTADFGDLDAIPAMPTDAFREFDVTCLAPGDRAVVFESSGTTEGGRSRNVHSRESVALYGDLAAQWFCDLGLASPPGGRFTFLSLTPDPEAAPRSSLARMIGVFVARFGSAGSGFFGALDPSGAWETDFAAIESALGNAPGPVFLTGTAFNYVRWADALAERGLRVRLPPGSRLMETGGYKGRTRELTKPELAALLEDRLGAPADALVTEYGMCELASQAYGRPAGGEDPPLRFPSWARVRVVSPETGRRVADGAPGVVQVIDLANVTSVLAVQTGDLGILAPDGLRLLGRRRQAGARGCSLMAA